MTRIPITKPSLDQADRLSVLDPLDSGWLVQGPRVAQFERAVAEYVGTPHAIATTSCTAALHLALLALGIGRGDEVILPSFTFVATANAIECTGARPIFVDIDLSTFNLSPADAEAAVTERTRAIIPVHLFGLAADMDATLALADRHGLTVIEDAACAIGTTYRGRHVGTLGTIGCFSFHPRKVITTGEGGMAVTGDPELATRLRALRNHGTMVSDLERHRTGCQTLPDYPLSGLNYRMTDIQGALGASQMTRLESLLQRRQQLAGRYDVALSGMPGLVTPMCQSASRHSYQSYVCRIDTGALDCTLAQGTEIRHHLMAALDEAGIATRQGTHAVHMLSYYRERYALVADALPHSQTADQLSIALPLYPQMTEAEQDEVLTQLRGHWQQIAGVALGSSS